MPKPSNVKLGVLGDDAGTETAAGPPAPAAPAAPADNGVAWPVLAVDVVSDVVCPWCWVGKRRLERAVALLGGELDVRVAWRPFQLNPGMPKEGIDRRTYRTRKFGTWEYSQQLDARLVAVGRAEGLDFRFDRIARTPNTLDAHRLVRLAGHFGVQDAVVEALFLAYFADGVDVGRREELVAVAASAGVSAADAERVLESAEAAAEVVAEEQTYKALGIDGVPGFVVGGTVVVTGAADPRVIADALRRAAA